MFEVKAEDFAKFQQVVDSNKIEFVDFRFTDIKGVWHHVSYTIKSIDKETFESGLPFDGSSIPFWQPINKSDMVLVPDASSVFVDPFTADPTAVVICDVWDIYKNQPYEFCPRSIAKRALAYLKTTGIGDAAFFGPENEFFVFDEVLVRDDANCQYYEVNSEEGTWNAARSSEDRPNTGHRPGVKGGYFPVQPVDSMVDLRAEMVKTLTDVGLDVNINHHEVAVGQGEIGVKFGSVVDAGDNVQKLKYVIKNVAHLNGKTATFMPKPLYGDNGSGMHCHQSIWKDGKNTFAGDKYQGLSDTALHYVGGVLKHARSIAAFTNASTNSYKRLIPGFEAPSILTYSAQNRSASCRVPYVSGANAKRIEFRFPDSSANPYLAFAAQLLAGIDGIKNQIHPGEPMEIDLFELSLDEIRAKGIEQMPHTLREAIECLLADRKFLTDTGVITDDFIQNYQHYKFKSEIWPWEARPHPFEFTSTYSC